MFGLFLHLALVKNASVKCFCKHPCTNVHVDIYVFISLGYIPYPGLVQVLDYRVEELLDYMVTVIVCPELLIKILGWSYSFTFNILCYHFTLKKLGLKMCVCADFCW